MFILQLFDASGILQRMQIHTRFQKLENWFNFWHFHVKQWGGFIIHVTISSFPHNFHPILFGWHVYNVLGLI
jgi:hypothetical protein